ncbi:MAG: hypothetical protein LUC35_01105 [Clostridiales bacterium]|nr:hypothetical protein [Clostridiales bacterium]
MISVIITILAFWVWPARDLRKVRAVKGIGFSEDAKLDQATVDGWKAGRIRAKKLWVGFGTLIVAGGHAQLAGGHPLAGGQRGPGRGSGGGVHLP